MVTGDRGIVLDIVKGVCLTVAIFIVYLQVPLAGMVAGVLAPLPVLYYHLKSGRWTVGAAAVAITALVLVFLGGLSLAVLYLLQAGLLSVALPIFLSRGHSASRALASAVFTVAVVAAVSIVGYGTAQGVDLHARVTAAIGTTLEQTAEFYKARGASGEELQFLKEGLAQVGALFSQIYPAMLLVSLAAVAGINLLVVARFRNRLKIPVPDTTISRFKNPEHLVWGLIVAGFSLLIDNGVVQAAALNVVVVAAFLYFMQGLAVVAHFFAAHRVPALFRVLFYVLLVLQAYLALAVALLGLFDLWADFRRPRIRENL
uniref:DUF2232 domain-containing protein n=1 Tax=Geobacter metallireducens TaxID=28232 RepID=A0A831UAM8_GEOME